LERRDGQLLQRGEITANFVEVAPSGEYYDAEFAVKIGALEGAGVGVA
jgi:hypothetical protein